MSTYLPAWHKEEKEHQQPLGNVLFLHSNEHFQKKNGMIFEVILVCVLALEWVLLVCLFAFFQFQLGNLIFCIFFLAGNPSLLTANLPWDFINEQWVKNVWHLYPILSDSRHSFHVSQYALGQKCKSSLFKCVLGVFLHNEYNEQ